DALAEGGADLVEAGGALLLGGQAVGGGPDLVAGGAGLRALDAVLLDAFDLRGLLLRCLGGLRLLGSLRGGRGLGGLLGGGLGGRVLLGSSDVCLRGVGGGGVRAGCASGHRSIP